MKSHPVLRPLLVALFACAAGLHAQSVVQTVNFNETDSYSAVTNPVQLVEPSFFTGTFDPFNAALGTLDSFVVEWNLTTTASGTHGGTISMAVVGSLFFNGDIYEGGVVAIDGIGGPPGSAFSFSKPVERTRTFMVAEAGTEYNATYLAAVTGESPFTLAYDATITFTPSGAATFDAATFGSVTLTYYYSAIPEPSTYALLAGLATLGLAAWRCRRGHC